MNEFTKESTQKIKGVAIVLMLIHHCFLSPERYEGFSVSFAPFTESFVNYWASFFKICVPIFVFITGYGLEISYKNAEEKGTLSAKKISGLTVKRYIKLILNYSFVVVCIWIASFVMQSGWFEKRYGTGLRSILYAFIDLLGLGYLFDTPMYMPTFWYMSLAQILIFVIPIVIYFHKKFGTVLTLAIVITLPFIITSGFEELPRYLIAATCGIICADKNLLALAKEKKWVKNGGINKILKFVVYLVIILALAFARQKNSIGNLIGTYDGIIAFMVILFNFEFIIDIPIVRKILSVLGKYSMYIFLIHNFTRSGWSKGTFIYGFHNAILIVLVLLVTSLAEAFILDKLKKIVRFDKFEAWCIKKSSILFFKED